DAGRPALASSNPATCFRSRRDEFGEPSGIERLACRLEWATDRGTVSDRPPGRKSRGGGVERTGHVPLAVATEIREDDVVSLVARLGGPTGTGMIVRARTCKAWATIGASRTSSHRRADTRRLGARRESRLK